MTTKTATTITLPVRTVSEANRRDHWAVRAKRAREQRGITCAYLRRYPKPELPVVVTVTRIGKRMMDRDNGIGALKHVIDGIADAYGVKDNDPRIEWRYGQETGKAYEVRVELVRSRAVS